MKTLNIFTPIIMTVLLLSCAGSFKKAPDGIKELTYGALLKQKLPLDKKIIKGKLSNGLTYYIRQNTQPENRAELHLVVNAGSILEDEDQQGLAHFCEHMSFNGTRHFQKQELVNYLESIGMRFGPDINAYTSFDETVYMLHVPTDSLPELDKAFMILQDWASAVSFDDDEIDKERGVIIEEWRLGRGASARMRDKQFPILFKGSHYAERLPIGKKAVLDTFHHQTLRQFYRDWYRPDLMAVVAVGDFDPEYIERLITRNFSEIPARRGERVRKIYPVPDHQETLFAIASDPEAQFSSVSIYHKLPSLEDSTVADYRNGLVEQLYNRMLNQRLQELTQQADPPFIFAGSGKGRFVRTSEIYMLNAAVKDNGIPRGFENLVREARRVQQYGFTQTELDRQKFSMLRFIERIYNERDKMDSDDLAAEYTRNFLHREPIPGIEYEYEMFQKLIPGIKLKEVNALAEKWNAPDNRVVLVNSPEKKGVEVPTEEQLQMVLNQVSTEAVEPYVDEVVTEKLIDPLPKPLPVKEEKYIKEVDVTEWKLYNGVRVILKPTDFKNDQVLMRAFSPGGYSLAADSILIAAETAEDLVRESGLGQFSNIQLQKLLADKVAGVAPSIGELYETLNGQTTPKDVETLFQLVYLYFKAPRADSTSYLSLREKLEGIYQNRNANPEAAFRDTLTVTLNQHNPRYKPWTVDTFKNMDMRKSYDFYRSRFADASDFTFIFVGNFDMQRMRELAETYLASLPSLNRQENWRDVTYEYPNGVIERTVYRGREPKSLNAISFTGSFEWSVENKYKADAMLDVLRIKLRERIRENLGGTYGVRIRGSFVHYPRERYKISLSFGSDPERVDELNTAIFAQIDSLRKFGTTTDYLNKVKEMHRREYETNLKENGYWLKALRLRYLYGLDPRGIIKGNEKIEALTLEDIRTAAQKYLSPDNYVRVVLYPENQTETQD